MFQPNSIPGVRCGVPHAVRTAALVLLVLAAWAAQARETAKPGRPDPLDPKASVPTLRYESSFAQYRMFRDDKPISWRDANDTVARIGGWRVYTREAQQADPPSAPAPAITPPGAVPPGPKPADTTRQPTPAGHAGHQKP